MLEMKVELLDHTGDPERLIALAAKLCYAGCSIEELKGRLTLDEIERFNAMLMEMGHESPLEHASYTFAVEGVSRITEQQLTRHRIASYCLSGDSIVYTDNSNRSVTKRTIRQLFNMKKQYRDMSHIRSVNEDNMMIVRNKIVDVTYSGQKEVYEVMTMDGYVIKSTKDHRFLTSNGWKRLEDIDINNDLLYTNGIEYYKDEEWLREQYIVQGHTQDHIAKICGVSTHTIRAWVKRFGLQYPKYFTKGHEPHNKGMNKDNYEPLKRTSEKMKNNINSFKQGKGEENKKYKHDDITISGGYTRAHRYFEKLNKCSVCGVEGKTEIHHIDKNPKNNSPENLKEVCKYCHKEIHHGSVIKHVKLSKIKQITYVGVEDTYDISMEAPHHNFIANGFVVHNSIQSGRYVTRNNATYYKPRLVNKSDKASKAFDKLTKFANETYEAITTSIEADLCYNYLKINNPEAIELVKPHEEELIVEVMKNINKKEYNKFHKQAIESARAVLPNSLQTKIIFTMNTRTLINFFNHRCCTRAQEEVRKLAYMMLAILKEKFPVLFGNVGASCKTKGYCPEGNMCCGIAPTLSLLLDVYEKYKDEYKASLNNK